jgi:hypothetical protein
LQAITGAREPSAGHSGAVGVRGQALEVFRSKDVGRNRHATGAIVEVNRKCGALGAAVGAYSGDCLELGAVVSAVGDTKERNPIANLGGFERNAYSARSTGWQAAGTFVCDWELGINTGWVHVRIDDRYVRNRNIAATRCESEGLAG